MSLLLFWLLSDIDPCNSFTTLNYKNYGSNSNESYNMYNFLEFFIAMRKTGVKKIKEVIIVVKNMSLKQ